MKTTYDLQIRAFPVVIRDEKTDEDLCDMIVLDKPRLQAAQLVGQSSKELIERIYRKHGYEVLEILKADKATVQIDLFQLYDDQMIQQEAVAIAD